MKTNRDKPCHNSFCEPAATERRSKKRSRIALMHTESLTRIFLTFSFFSMQRDFKRICKRERLRLLRCSDCPVIYCYLVYILSL